MYKLHLREPADVIKNGTEIRLTAPLYNVTDIKFLEENGFFKCWKCKDYFDHANNFGDYHPKKDGRDYCDTCYSKVEA